MNQRAYQDCLISLGFDFGELHEEERKQMFPGLTEEFGYMEVFVRLQDILTAFYLTLLEEYPDFIDPKTGHSFFVTYHDAPFKGGVFAYDVAYAICVQLTLTPYGDHSADAIGAAAYHRIKSSLPPASLTEQLQDILGTHPEPF